jgi:uncharacterized protein YceH (UPF0502 family)
MAPRLVTPASPASPALEQRVAALERQVADLREQLTAEVSDLFEQLEGLRQPDSEPEI